MEIKKRPALFVGECRADDLEPDTCVHERGFVQDNACKRAAAKGHGVFGALEFDGGVVDQFDLEVGFIFGANKLRWDDLFDRFPGNVFCHSVRRGAVKERFADG